MGVVKKEGDVPMLRLYSRAMFAPVVHMWREDV